MDAEYVSAAWEPSGESASPHPSPSAGPTSSTTADPVTSTRIRYARPSNAKMSRTPSPPATGPESRVVAQMSLLPSASATSSIRPRIVRAAGALKTVRRDHSVPSHRACTKRVPFSSWIETG